MHSPPAIKLLQDLAGSDVPNLRSESNSDAFLPQITLKALRTYPYGAVITSRNDPAATRAESDRGHRASMTLKSLQDLAGSEVPNPNGGSGSKWLSPKTNQEHFKLT